MYRSDLFPASKTTAWKTKRQKKEKKLYHFDFFHSHFRPGGENNKKENELVGNSQKVKWR